MAKLSAHGIELLRIEKTVIPEPNKLTIKDRYTRSYRSDGTILEKVDVVFRPGPYDPPEGRPYSYGWKLKKRTGYQGEEWFGRLRAIVGNAAEFGWEVQVNGIPIERKDS